MWTATESLHRALFLFVCGSTLLFSGTNAVKSKYACQEEKLRLRCEESYVIRVYAANYGRLEPGTSICPSKNISTLNCKAPNVLLKMTSKCANRRRCTVKADNTMFGDPCPGTFKYLDVIYGCVPGIYWTPTPTTRRIKHRTTRGHPTTNTTASRESSSSPSTKPTTKKTTIKLSTTQRIFSENITGTTRSNITSNETANITSTHSWSRKVTTWTKEPTSSASPPKVAKGPKSKASGDEGGEERVVIALLRSLYLTYRFIKENPRDTLVVFLSSVAAATVSLLLFLLAVHLCKKHRRKRRFAMKRKKAEEGDDGNKIKSVTIEIQGSDDETKEIDVNPGDIIIIDHNDANQSGSEDLGYLSEIVRFYNSQNIGSDDQISIRKQFSTCDSPSVISTSESRDSKYDSAGINTRHCTCQQGVLLRPSSPLGIM